MRRILINCKKTMKMNDKTDAFKIQFDRVKN